jgi:hypothetical protein
VIINRKIALAVLALAVGLTGLSNSAPAATKKKVTLEQAWKTCKQKVDKQYGKNTSETNAMARYQLGASCMKDLGYPL